MNALAISTTIVAVRPAAQKPPARSLFAEPASPLERFALKSGLWAYGITWALIALPFMLGDELACFPRLEQPAHLLAAVGVLAASFAVAACAWSVAGTFLVERRVSPAPLLGLAFAVGAAGNAPVADLTLWNNFGPRTHGCVCEPAGLLGAVSSDAWKSLYAVSSAGSLRRCDWFDPYFRKPASPQCAYTSEDCDPWVARADAAARAEVR